MTNKKSKDGLSVLLRRFAAGGMTLCMAASALQMAAEAAAVKEHSVRPLSAVNDISYNESTANTHDPYKGFYHAIQMNFKRDKTNCKLVEKKLEDINDWVGEYDLVHLRIDLSDFSKNNDHDSDADINSNTDDVEAALKKLLTGLRSNGQTAIIRFAYDKDYNGKTSGSSRTVWEPEKDSTILGHQATVGAVLNDYTDVIASLELGIIGPWGEIHGSDRKIPSQVKLYVQKWLDVLDDDITVSVRTPEQYAWYLGYDESNTKNVLKNMSSSSYTTKIGSDEYRVGIFNDGYLGSVSDRGTYLGDRKQEIAWLSNQAKHTLYGGEIVLWEAEEDDDTEPYNNIDYMTKESFSTHTAYLNKGWNENVTDVFRETSYKSGSSTTNSKRDPVYLKSGITQYDYLQNHMGYRFVVKDVKLTKETTVYENFSINTKIENVGFGNLIKNEKAKLIIKGNGKQQTYDLSALNKKVGESAENYDPRYWDSGKDINNKGVTYLTATVDIPDSFPTGDYKVYLKIANDVKDQGEYPVHFANEGDIFDESLNANFLGNFKIVAGTKLSDSSSQAASSSSSKAPSVSSSKPATASSSKASTKSSSKPATASSSKASTKSSSKPATASSSKASTKSSSKPATVSSSKASTKSSSKPATASSSKASTKSSSKPAT
ncbi:MAG: DUF4832 domain-containing protein, partial [Ruminococcus sp.]|nr:DUF4832 domain-containing protein [Ruminococcus sp.]